MATFKFLLYKSNVKRDGLYPVCLRVTKDRKLKYILIIRLCTCYIRNY